MEPTTSTTARDELARLISSRHTMAAVDAILAAGYRKPTVLGYAITRNGHILNDTQYDTRAEAQDRVEWLNSCRLEGQTADYRVAEIVESAA